MVYTTESKQVTRHGFTFTELNAYSLICGHVQSVEYGKRSLRLFHEFGSYVVQYSDYDRKPTEKELKLRAVSAVGEDGFYQVRRTSDTCKYARELFNTLLREVMPFHFEIRGNYGCGYETVTSEPSYSMAKETLETYQENESGTSFIVAKVKDVPNA